MQSRSIDDGGGRPRGARAKAMGAYYTDVEVAEFLAWWAIRSPDDRVLDPAFGGGVFLRAASRRLIELGGTPAGHVFGVEIDDEVHRRAGGEIGQEFGIGPDDLLRGDFFDLEPTESRAIDAVIGNPPYIRYQRFAGESRQLALARCRSQNVHLPELSSSWAPFLVHCISMLRRGGRLAMVLPMEAVHAKYARPVLDHIRSTFGTVTFLTFREKLFPELNEDAILLLAEGKGEREPRFLLRDLAHPGLLRGISDVGRRSLAGTRGVDAAAIASGKSRLIGHLIPRKARELYEELKSSARAVALGELADVGIGYVTGANDFFHLSPAEARRLEIPESQLKPVLRRGRALEGLRFTQDDWLKSSQREDAGFLLHLGKEARLPAATLAYLRFGESRGVHRAYKCRTRSPWYCVPHVHRADAFLSYMSGSMPRLLANDAGAYAPNTLHVVRMRPLVGMSGASAAVLWQTSLVRLSVEMEGHPLGGGMLKLEPTEAGNVLLPSPGTADRSRLAELVEELDPIVRRQGDVVARARADRAVLVEMLGLSEADCRLLAAAANKLRSRRGYEDSLNGVA